MGIAEGLIAVYCGLLFQQASKYVHYYCFGGPRFYYSRDLFSQFTQFGKFVTYVELRNDTLPNLANSTREGNQNNNKLFSIKKLFFHLLMDLDTQYKQAIENQLQLL